MVAVNNELGIFICLACQSGYTAEGEGGEAPLCQHLSTAHSIKMDRELKNYLSMVASNANIDILFPQLTNSNPPVHRFFNGLKLTKHYGCPTCPTAGSKEYVQRHIRQESSCTGVPVTSVWTQVLNTGVTKQNIRVQVASSNPSSLEDTQNSALKLFQDFKIEELQKDIPNSCLVDARWMWTNWHGLISNHDALRIVAAMAPPAEPVDSEEDHSTETHHSFLPPMSHLPSPPPTQAKLQHTAQMSPKRSQDYSGELSFVVRVVGFRN
jgi:hypothetical protein